MKNHRRLIYSRKDTSGTWGEIARNENLDTHRWFRRSLSRFVYILSALLVGTLVGTAAFFIYSLVYAQPNVNDVVDRATKSMFQVICGDFMGAGVAIEMEVPSSYKTAVWTAAHVVDNCEIGDLIELRHEDEVLFGTLAARDPDKWDGTDPTTTDLAVIYLRKEFPTLEAAPQADVGDWSIVIGNPWGEINYVSFGVVSAVTQSEYKTDAAVNEGNSGGPMIDSQGRVLGLVSYKPVQTEGTVTGTDAVVSQAEGIAAIKRLRLACSVVLNDVPTCPFSN